MGVSRVRLMQVMAGGSRGGAEAFFERLAVALEAPDLQQQLAIRRDPGRTARLRAAGLQVSEHAFGGRLDLATPWQLRRLARRFRPDVTLSWMNRGTRMAPAAPGVLVGRIGGFYSLKYYRRCQHLIGISPAIIDHIVRAGWPAERAHHLPNFVSVDSAPAEPRAANDTPADAPLILAIGRLHPVKGFDILLAALARLPEAVLWLAGSGPAEAELRRQADDLGVAGRVRWLGWRSDVGALYRACDVFACPSRQEGLGSVILEGWAYGAPVVASNIGGPATLLKDGETGLLVPSEDAAALADALARVLDRPSDAQALAAAGKAAHADGFSEAAVVGRYREFLRSVADGSLQP